MSKILYQTDPKYLTYTHKKKIKKFDSNIYLKESNSQTMYYNFKQ